jgi:hypothetical protein
MCHGAMLHKCLVFWRLEDATAWRLQRHLAVWVIFVRLLVGEGGVQHWIGACCAEHAMQ